MDANFLSTDGRLTPMEETPYDNEALLHKPLADFSDRVVADGAAARLILIRRETPVADSSGVNVMSLDHPFIDSEVDR